MDSTSVDEKAQKEDTLQSASTHRPSSISHRNGASARVVLTDHSSDDETEMDEEEEEAAPVSKPMRPNSNHATREKPVFSNSGTHPSVPFDLCDFRGDRVPYTINRYLRDYQREGIRFMYNNYTNSRGCILGDDMGLGKTVQVIGFLAAVLHKTGTWEDIENNKPQFLHSQIPSMQSKRGKVFLIVAPLSVLYNWKEELDTWGYFQCVVVHGLRKDEELARIRKGRIEIALTTYETLRLCLDNFNTIDWSAVVVDEAHKIKNPNSQITQAMKSLKCQIRIGLTGTILQNNLEELWCVMDWAIPGCLGTLAHFRNTYSNPVEQGQRHSATKRALATGRKMVRALARKISHWFLRRTKALIQQQMPKKDDRVVYCSLTDFQKTVYQTVLDSEDVTLLLKSSEKCGCLSGRARRSCCYTTNSQGVRVKYMYFSYMTILRKVASHVALLQSTAATSKKQEKYASAICQKVFQKFPDFVQRCKDEAFEALSDPMYSGKMKVLQKLLRYYLQRRDKVLLFSLSTKLLDVLESYCMAEGLDYSRLDGTTKSKDRVQIVKEFNKSNHINICLVSTLAGGLGLNFVGANVVILFDPTWNPANDLQAIDRAYRIGQCRDVTVLRLISLGTVEEVIYLRQVYKQQLQSSVVGNESARRYFEAVQGHGVHKGELFGIKNLFRLQTEGTCLTRMILEREGQVEAGVMTTTTHMGEEREEEPNGVSEQRHPEEQRDLSTIPKSVLDFSSGSEEDDGQQQGVRKKASDSVASPGRTSLLQQGFSKLLQRVKARPDLLEEDSSSGVEESTSARDDKDQEFTKKGNASSGINKNLSAEKIAPVFLKSGAKDGDDLRKERVSFSVRKELEESDGTTSPDNYKPNQLKAKAPKSRHFEVYSDESDDLNVEAVTRPPTNFNLQNRERGLGKNKKRQRVSAREKARSKYTEEIETFTSSEDEHTPVKTARSGNRHSLTPRKDRSTTELLNKRKAGESKTVSFSHRDGLTSPACKGKERTIDNVLGAVQEVAYTHSNQRVVGGSKAEEKISRAAVRDVFERKMYSQLPANHLLTQEESLSSSPPDSPPRPPAAIRPERPTADHPVTFYKKSTHNTRQTTFIIGGTPEAMRRQQLEEMASKFKFTSLDQFALEILKTTSTQRVEWLRQYYHSLNHPELANIVTGNFPQPNAAQMPSSSSAVSTPSTKVAPHTETRDPQRDVPKLKRHKYCKKNEAPMKPGTLQNYVSPSLKKQESPLNHVPETQKKQTNPQKNVLAPPSDVPSPESEKQEETDCSARRHKRTKRGSVSSSGAVRAGGGLGVDQASSSGLGPQEAAAFLIHTDAPSSPDLSHCWSTTLSKPAAEGVEREQTPSARTKEALRGRKEQSSALSPSEPSTSSRSSLLTDLLGDTSILDDLFKPKSRGAQQNSSPKTTPPVSFTAAHVPPSPGAAEKTHSGPTDTWPSHRSNTQDARRTASKGTRKDFWDILNEGNEESINRLTDLAEVQRVCVKANFVAKSRPAEEEEKKSLWKTNEKFLWKK